MANKVEQLELSFTLNAQSVEQAGAALRAEIEKGLGSISFDALRRNAASTSKKIGEDLKKALTQEVRIDTKALDKSLDQYQNRRLKIERKLAEAAGQSGKGAAKSQAALDKVRLKELRKLINEERKLFRERGRSMALMNAQAKAYLATMKKASKYGGGGFGGAAQLPEVPSGGKGGGRAKTPKGKGKSGGLMNRMMGGMSKSGASALTKAGPMLGKAAAGMGKAAAALGIAAVAIGATVGVLAGLLAVMMAADSAAKDMNKTFLQSAGGADLMGQAFGKTGDAIDAVRGAAVGAQFQLKSLAKDNIEILKTLHEHGTTIRELTKDAKHAGEAMSIYTQSMRMVLQTSRMIGESATTVAQNMSTASEELGMTLDGVAKRFSNITRFAMESGFSTKRFYSMVIQATSGMTMYNVRLEEAAGMLVRIGKILGQKTGGEFLSSLSKGFVNESMTARIKRTKLAGTKNTQATFDRSAKATTDAFQEDLFSALKEGGVKSLDLSTLSSKMSGDMATMKPGELRKQLDKLDPKEQAKFLAKFGAKMQTINAKAADGLRQRLDVLIDVNKGSKGGLLNMSKHLGSLDMGGKLNMYMDSMKSMFRGKELHELSTKQLAALESATGMSGEQLHQMRKLSQGLTGNFAALQEAAKGKYKGMSDADVLKAQKEQIKAFGAFADKSGKIIAAKLDSDGNIDRSRDSQGNLVTIDSQRAYNQSFGKRLDATEKAKSFNEDRAISQQIADNTWSMADMLKAGVSVVLEKIYGVVKSILNFVIPQEQRTQVEGALKQQASFYEAADSAGETKSKLEKQLQKLTIAMEKEGDVNKRENLNNQITNIKGMIGAADMEQQLNMALGNKVFNSDGSVNQSFDRGQKVVGTKGALEQFAAHAGFYATSSDLANRSATATKFDKAQHKKQLQAGMKAHSSAESSIKEILGEEKYKQFKNNPDMAAYFKQNEEVSVDVSQNKDTVAKAKRARDYNVSNTATKDAVSGYSLVSADNSGVTVSDGDAAGTGLSQAASSDLNVSRHGLALSMKDQGRGDISGEIAGLKGGYGNWLVNMNAAALLDGDMKHWIPEAPIDLTGKKVDQTKYGGDSNDYGTTVPEFGMATTPMGYDQETLESYAGTPFNQLTTSSRRKVDPSTSTYVDKESIADQAANKLGIVRLQADANPQTHHTAQDGDLMTVGSSKMERGVGMQVSADVIKGSADAYAHILENPKTGATDSKGAAEFYNQVSNMFLKAGGTAESGVPTVGTVSNPVMQNTAGGIYQKGVETKIGAVADKTDGEVAKEVSKYLQGGVFDSLPEVEKSMKEFAKQQGGQFTLDAWKAHVSQTEPRKVKAMEEAFKKQREMKILLARLKKLAEDKKKSDAKKEEEGISKILRAVGMGGNAEAKKMLQRGGIEQNSTFMTKLNKYKTQDVNTYQAIVNELVKMGIKMPAVNDFIYQGGAKGGVITPIHSGDDFLGMRKGGGVDNALTRNAGGGGTGTINVNVYSNNLEEVKRAIYTAARNVGIGGRKKSTAGTGNFGKMKA